MGSKSLSSEERLKWYERVLEFSRKAQDQSLESVCRYLMDDTIQAAGADNGYLFLIDSKGEWKTTYARTHEREDIPKKNQAFSESIMKRAIEMGAPLIVDEATTHPEFKSAKSVIAMNLKSVLVLPLFFEKKHIGVLYLENRNQSAYFSPELLDVLTLFSTQGAVLLHLKLQKGLSLETEAVSKDEFESKSATMQKVSKQAESASKVDSSVLILGETGTGKEVLARRIHSLSTRGHGPFVAINCTAIPETLLESELFGYRKGAFTGAASDREGLIQRANQGTLFLDEIGDLPLHMQAKLLRVLQEKKFTRLGSTTEETSNFRLICATHKPLEDSVQQGLFRQDLYFRINTIIFQLPALRERTEDLLDLALSFVREASSQNKKNVRSFNERASSILLRYEWPGNIRELQNACQRAVALIDESATELTAEDFQFLSKKPVMDSLPSLHEAKEEFIRDYVKKAILIHQGNKTKAAKALGVDPKTLYRHLLEKREDEES